MDYKQNYLTAYKQMEEAATERLKRYGKTLDVEKTLKQKLMKEKGYQTTKEICEDVWDDYRSENVYSCVFEGKHEQFYCCDILKVRYNKKSQQVEVYLYDSYYGCLDEWVSLYEIGWGLQYVWMTILDFIDE